MIGRKSALEYNLMREISKVKEDKQAQRIQIERETAEVRSEYQSENNY